MERQSKSPRRPLLSWRPTSSDLLAHAERQMLQVGLGKSVKYEQRMVEVGKGRHINTVIAGSGDPLVIMHGFAAGLALFVCNIKDLAQHYTVYALDMIGFGRSSRPKVQFKTPEQAEDFFLDHFEAWREAMHLDRFTLLGHSLGGYLSSCYTMRCPQHVEHLIVADMWGILPKPEDEPKSEGLWRFIKTSLNHFTPLAPLRFAGPLGPNIMKKLRPDLEDKFAHMFVEDQSEGQVPTSPNQSGRPSPEKRSQGSEETNAESRVDPEGQSLSPAQEWELMEVALEEQAARGLERAQVPSRVVLDYIYHINARTPATGEQAFRKLLVPIHWPARPLMDRFNVDPSIPITMLYGSLSWIHPRGVYELKKKLPNQVEVIPIHMAGHHLYVDNIPEFNGAILTSMSSLKLKHQTGSTDTRENAIVASSCPSSSGSTDDTNDAIGRELVELELEEFVEVDI